MNKVRLLSLFAFCFTGLLFAEEYYVAVDGVDSANGAKETPFRTMQKAADIMAPGDTCFIREGRYTTPLLLDGLVGAPEKPMVFTAYKNEKVVLDGTAPVTSEWVKHQGSIYKTRLAQDMWQIFIGEKMMTSARWPKALAWSDEMWDMAASWRRQTPNSVPGHIFDSRPGDDTEGSKADEGYAKYDLDANINTVSLAESGIDFTGAVAIMNIGSWLSWAQTVEKHGKGKDNFTYSLDFSKSGTAMSKAADKFLQNESFWKVKKHQGHYYFQGLMCLTSEEEWHYSPESKTLYLWAPQSQIPRNVVGKIRDYNLIANNSSYLAFKNLSFFATTFKLNQCDHILIEDCSFSYPSFNKLALGDFQPPDMGMVTSVDCETTKRSENILRNCQFEYMDGSALVWRGNGDLIENCLFHDIDFTCLGTGGAGSIGMINSINLTFRRNTIHTAGNSEGYRGGKANLIELNNISNMGLLQHDGSAINIGVSQQKGTIVRHNWSHDTLKQGIRFDAVNRPGTKHNAPAPANTLWYGFDGNCNHNVVWNVHMNQMKGERHRIYNNIFFDGRRENLGVINKEDIGGFNKETITRNNLCESIVSLWYGPKEERQNYPGIMDHNRIAPVRPLLRDADNLDFRPRADSGLIDAGAEVEGEKFNYLDKAPDIGAYEYNDNNYWIPGRQTPEASTPVPPDMATNIKTDADLMWLEGYKAHTHNVYFGDNRDAVESANESECKAHKNGNIFDPGKLESGKTYFWRVDAIGDNSSVKGKIWRFKTL